LKNDLETGAAHIKSKSAYTATEKTTLQQAWRLLDRGLYHIRTSPGRSQNKARPHRTGENHIKSKSDLKKSQAGQLKAKTATLKQN
jgi:hypothetical protein